ncbi:hypothetical protein [Bacteroides thetaiotaomicron]|uniref:hypothetical protein n=1 Tax=Bacteroides thetaiotaomicron TaxID=818 RepID=UPI002165795E|nr:hypothetical protein [Bacteroides thetaiotaomicron]MCS3195399.1 hypothetical protein [Bacteroides thetaiotaomicron]
MEAENALTIAKENSKENFFEEEARLWAEVYGMQSDKPDLEYLQRMLESMNHLLLSLELPWERFIPILYRSFALYMRRPDENTNNRKAYQLSAQLMDSVVYLSQNTNLIHHIHLFCNMQIAALEKLRNEKVETEKVETEKQEIEIQGDEIQETRKQGIEK